MVFDVPLIFCLPIKGGDGRFYVVVGSVFRKDGGRRFVVTAGRVELARHVQPHVACQRRPGDGARLKGLSRRRVGKVCRFQEISLTAGHSAFNWLKVKKKPVRITFLYGGYLVFAKNRFRIGALSLHVGRYLFHQAR